MINLEAPTGLDPYNKPLRHFLYFESLMISNRKYDKRCKIYNRKLDS